MISDAKQTRNSCSPADALAMKNAALRAVLKHLECGLSAGESFKDERSSRLLRMVKLALEASCELEHE